ncbi:MAG: CBS domain-containing protein [Candidatus Sericytochromatia bacterium]
MFVKDIMHSGNIHTIASNNTIEDAAIKMTQLNVGALVVGSIENMEGIFSERDILKKVVGVGLDVANTIVKQAMTSNIATIKESENIYDALDIMQRKKIRHLPVVDFEGKCIGMLGIRDVMKAVSQMIEKENEALVKFISEV